MLSNSIKNRFVKDYGLPIQLVQEPFFSYFIELYEPLFGTKSKLELLEQTIRQHGGEKPFFDAMDEIKNRVVGHITTKPRYADFNAADAAFLNTPLRVDYSKRNIYTAIFNGVHFISVDLKKANFQSLRWFDPELVDHCADYETFIQQFTDLPYFIHSKNIRQVVFGQLNPKRFALIQRIIMQDVVLAVTAAFGTDKVISLSEDEFIVTGISREALEPVVKAATSCDLHIREFVMEQIDPAYTYCVKRYSDSAQVELKNIPAYVFAQVYRRVRGETPHANDLCFFFEEQIATFKEPLFR